MSRFFLNLWMCLAVLSFEMDDKNTNPAPADQSKSVVDLDQVRAAAKFGTIGFEQYVAHAIAESNRFFQAQSRGV